MERQYLQTSLPWNGHLYHSLLLLVIHLSLHSQQPTKRVSLYHSTHTLSTFILSSSFKMSSLSFSFLLSLSPLTDKHSFFSLCRLISTSFPSPSKMSWLFFVILSCTRKTFVSSVSLEHSRCTTRKALHVAKNCMKAVDSTATGDSTQSLEFTAPATSKCYKFFLAPFQQLI